MMEIGGVPPARQETTSPLSNQTAMALATSYDGNRHEDPRPLSMPQAALGVVATPATFAVEEDGVGVEAGRTEMRAVTAVGTAIWSFGIDIATREAANATVIATETGGMLATSDRVGRPSEDLARQSANFETGTEICLLV
jgi:hypothetical protein